MNKHLVDSEKVNSQSLEEICGNGIQIPFEILDIQWINTEAKPTYHGWPTLANVGNDKLALVCSGDREGHIDPFGKVVLYESCDGGKTWSAPRIIANGPLDDRDAGLVVTPAGTWLINYFTSLAFASINTKETTPAHWKEVEDKLTISTIKAEHGFFMMRSEDQGKTWSEKYLIPVNNVHGPIVLNDGSLFYCGRGLWNSCMTTATLANEIVSLRSTDDGKTWEEISKYYSKEIEGHDFSKWHELHSIQTADGSIIAQIRHDNSTWQMSSKDGGKTWENLHRVCGGFPSHLMKLADGRLLMSYGYRRENYGNRCRISSDNGQSWSEPMILSGNAPSLDLGYPSTVQLSDGTLVTAWYELRPELNVASLRVARWKLC
jgi:Neuraminidase (sialidase)